LRAQISRWSQFKRNKPLGWLYTKFDAEVVLKLSSNIAAGGSTSTTYQLTAPAGKSTSDFEAGKITDDTNPLASFNPSSGKYSEWELCFEVKVAKVANNDEIEFRMTNGGTVLDTYSATPKITISTGGAYYVPAIWQSYRQRR